MGKKRRLKSVKVKFSGKHSNHPRMQMLLGNQDTEEAVRESSHEKTVELQPKVDVREETAAPPLKVALHEETIAPEPKVTSRFKRTKEKTRKRATKRTTI